MTVYDFMKKMGDYEQFYISVAGKDITNDKSVCLHDIKVLIIDEFTAQGATFEQVKKVFELSNITLLKFSDVQGGYINAKS